MSPFDPLFAGYALATALGAGGGSAILLRRRDYVDAAIFAVIAVFSVASTYWILQQ